MRSLWHIKENISTITNMIVWVYGNCHIFFWVNSQSSEFNYNIFIIIVLLNGVTMEIFCSWYHIISWNLPIWKKNIIWPFGLIVKYEKNMFEYFKILKKGNWSGAKRCGSHLSALLDISIMKHFIKKRVGTKVFWNKIFS